MIGFANGRPARRWRASLGSLVVALVATTILFGCGGADYADDNIALAERLFNAGSALEVIGSSDMTYCSTDRCSGSNDRVATNYQVRVVGTIDDVVAAFYAAYPEFDVYDEACAEADCAGGHVVSANEGERLVYLTIYANLTGTLLVDVHVPDDEPAAES